MFRETTTTTKDLKMVSAKFDSLSADEKRVVKLINNRLRKHKVSELEDVDFGFGYSGMIAVTPFKVTIERNTVASKSIDVGIQGCYYFHCSTEAEIQKMLTRLNKSLNE